MIRFLTILFILTFEINAIQLVDVYRQQGADAVVDEIEKTLQTKNYWESYIANKDVKYGYYEDEPTIVIVDKNAKKLQVHHHKEGKSNLKLIQDVIVGKMGDKKKEGDLKTPVGVYEVRKRFTPSDPFYGPVAFSLSYPNTMDKLEGKDGHGIWIHGYPVDGSERDDRTKGCVVMTNDLLKEFDGVVGKDKAITIISETGIPKTNKEEMSLILSQLFQWKDAWKRSNVNKYLSFYDKEFKRFDGMKYKAFERMKKQIFARKEDKLIKFRDIQITPYPNKNGRLIYRIAFHENYKTKKFKFRGYKELYVELKNKNMKILAEK